MVGPEYLAGGSTYVTQGGGAAFVANAGSDTTGGTTGFDSLSAGAGVWLGAVMDDSTGAEGS